ncbi:aminodeoxychorismate synthase component I [Ornithinicoccus hortensis]|uniref:aminodeoxychorismate synthase n=1 Tax=Ornithinicoccus hortensis TaxID=82346 RepID=A0A542YNR6_9MICO|nr:aminodeoxychorismate synthase component I [Ornithinicoccus hortensis]TQL49755.1 para-aminobenzoate synthetase [Ornithinicoccus hortensis]
MERGRVLLIDNVDSFTFNIADLLHRVLGRPPVVWGHDHPASAEDLRGFAAIVVGPGPGRPQHAADMGLSDLALRQREVPVLGICLGHQGLAHLAGDEVVELAEPMHGRVGTVEHDGSGLFEGVPSPFRVVRYHSLEVRPAPASPLRVTARTREDGCVMGLADPGARRWGVQFHPESVLSEHGDRVVANFLRLAGVPVETDPQGGAVATGDVLDTRTPQVSGSRAVEMGVCSVPGPVDPWLLHNRLVGGSASSFWLDSSAGAAQGAAAVPAARFSVIGDAGGPLSCEVTHRVGTGSTVRREGLPEERLPGRLLDTLDTLLARWELVGTRPRLPFGFRPGLVGYLGYELKAETDGSAAHPSPHPDAWLVFADRAVVIDHHTDEVYAVYLHDPATRAVQQAWADDVRALVSSIRGQTSGVTPPDGPDGPDGPGVPGTDPAHDAGAADVVAGLRHTESAYRDLIARCQKEIRAGESYEICLTNTVTWPHEVDPAAAYRALRSISPVPFGAWLRRPGLDVVGSSPERFLALDADGRVEARPIKGTRPRDPDPARDAALAHDLATAVKDRAENLMIVDLLRHDLHRVCRSGSVHVPELFAVESYATVHQLVSTIRGTLAPGKDALDLVASCFPGGSMTGAPKVRTMELLDGFEDGPRGVYSGVIGWFGLDGAMDLSIVIRTATVVQGRAEFGIGGAITALSDPAEEFAETLHKARALGAALSLAHPGQEAPGQAVAE